MTRLFGLGQCREGYCAKPSQIGYVERMEKRVPSKESDLGKKSNINSEKIDVAINLVAGSRVLRQSTLLVFFVNQVRIVSKPLSRSGDAFFSDDAVELYPRQIQRCQT